MSPDRWQTITVQTSAFTVAARSFARLQDVILLHNSKTEKHAAGPERIPAASERAPQD
ncbi:MAG: hypothetical protein ACOYYS_25965 [Chloroflexota bacterium]